MTATLYLNITVYPMPPGSFAPIFCDAWPASQFSNEPSGASLPPGPTPVASGSTVAGAVALAGLDNTKGYRLRVFNPQGYTHWFPVGWASGNTAEAPMVISVPGSEGASSGDQTYGVWSQAGSG